MKRFSYLILLVALLVSACAGLAPEPTATAVPTSTATQTPAPTATPLPTDTPTPEPTATPDAAATAAAQATAGAAQIQAEMADLLDDEDMLAQTGRLIWSEPETLEIRMTGPANNVLEIEDQPAAGDFILKTDVTWNTSGLILCGVAFRSEDNILKGRQYRFLYLRLSGLPAWAIELHEFGQFKNSPTDVKFSNALDLANGATNELVLIVQDDAFTLYINGVRQGRYYDYSKQRTEGIFAFLGSQDSGKGSCEFENSWIWSLDE